MQPNHLPDLNHDGKIDSRDYALYDEICNDNKPPQSAPRSHYTGSDSAGGYIATILCVAYLSVLIPGDIPINGFTMFIGLICAVVLGIKILAWAYR